MKLENKMKKILYIATSNFFIDTGGGIANRAFYNVLNSLYPGMVDVIHTQVKEDIEVPSNFYQIPPLSNIERIKLLIKGRIHRYYYPLLEYLETKKDVYSHCFINTGVLGDLVEELHKRNICVAVIHHNYEVEFQRDNKRPTTFWGLFTNLVRKNEKLSYQLSDLNLFLTASDYMKFKKEYGQPSCEGNFIVGVFEPEPRNICVIESELKKDHLAICGSLNSVQTLAGIKNFVSNYLALLHSFYNNNFKLTITGRSPGKFIQELGKSDKNIIIVPSPINITEVIKSCGIFLCPTNVGSGIKLRIMDGLKLGMPIITHEISAHGYDSFFSKPWFRIYKDEESFERALKDVNKEIDLNSDLRQIIIKEYVRNFSYENGYVRFSEAISGFINE